MVKIFGWEPFGEKVIEASSDKGAYWRDKSDVRTYKLTELKDYFSAYYDHDLVRAPIDDLVESALGQGYYTSVDETGTRRQPLLNIDRRSSAFKAKELVDDFGRFHNLDSLLPNIQKIALIAGFCPVETILTADPEKCSLKIVHPLTLKKNEGIFSKDGKVTKIVQKVGQEENEILGEKLAWFTYGMIGTAVTGVSLVRGMLSLINTLNKTTADVDAILNRYIAPLGVWKSHRKIGSIKTAAMERDAGEDIFLGELTNQELESELVKFYQIDPRIPFWDYIMYLDRRIYAYSRANNTWYSRNATEASAKVVDAIVIRHVTSIQRDIKRPVEGYWFQPLVELNSLSVVPKMNFGVEKTGVEDIQLEGFLTAGLELGFISQSQYFTILRDKGVKILAEQVEEPPEEPEDEEEPAEEQYAIHQYPSVCVCLECDAVIENPGCSCTMLVCPNDKSHGRMVKKLTMHDDKRPSSDDLTKVKQLPQITVEQALEEPTKEVVKIEREVIRQLNKSYPKTKSFNAVYDVMRLLRVHARDFEIPRIVLEDFTAKYCRRYGMSNVAEVTDTIKRLIRDEGYTVT